MRLIDADGILWDNTIIYGRTLVDKQTIDRMPTIDPATLAPRWRDAKTDPPKVYRDRYEELIPFLVCEEKTEYPFRAFYDGKTWGDGFFAISVTHWMELPQSPKGKG